MSYAYFDSAEGETITLARAIRECRSHGADPEEMISELGEHPTYDAQTVLVWLGY